jgi:hypothetical protein
MQSGQLAYDAGCMSVRRSRQIRDELDVKRDLTRSLAAAASVWSSKNVSFFRHVSSGLASFPKPMESQFSNERQKQKSRRWKDGCEAWRLSQRGANDLSGIPCLSGSTIHFRFSSPYTLAVSLPCRCSCSNLAASETCCSFTCFRANPSTPQRRLHAQLYFQIASRPDAM